MTRAFAQTGKWVRAVGAGVGWVAAITGLWGCASGGTTEQAAGQRPQASPVQHTLLQNIPLPAGFRMVPERSVARESGQFRVAQCEFEGATSPEAVTRFYVEYMPTAHFTLRHKRFDSGEYSLRFESDSEECNVRVRSKNTKTILVIDVGPLARGSTERTYPPGPPR